MPIYTIAEIITFHYSEREREREREGGCCVASFKKNLPCTFYFFYM